MILPPLPRVAGPMSTTVDAVDTSLKKLAASPLVDAVVLPPQVINTTDTRIYHGLGRLPVGYFLVKSPSVVNVLGDGLVPESKDPTNYIVLRMAFSDTVTLVVF